jgi:hypothetical protein
MKGRIKRGASISHDHSYMRWPSCFPSGCTRSGIYEAADPDMLFDVRWIARNDGSGYWDCTAEGFGYQILPGAYGNGSIFVFDKENVEIAEHEQNNKKL